MNTLVIVLIAAVCLIAGYTFYGSWLAKKWGIDPKAKTPAVAKNDISSLHGFQMEKEKGKGNCVGMLGNKKSFVSLTYARRRSFQKTLRDRKSVV